MLATIESLLLGVGYIRSYPPYAGYEAMVHACFEGIVRQGHANDESGNGNNGTPVGPALVADRFGTANSAYDFNGVDDRIEIPIASSLNGMTEMTLSAWVKTTSDGIIPAKGNNDAGGQWQYSLTVNLGSGRVIAYFNQGATHLSAVGTSNVNDGEWHSVIGTIKNNVEANIYLDGVLSLTATPSSFGWNLSGSSPLAIGTNALGTQSFDGQIDDVRIYNRILSQQEISALVPEPSTFLLAALGLLSLRYHGRRRR